MLPLLLTVHHAFEPERKVYLKIHNHMFKGISIYSHKSKSPCVLSN